MSNEINYGDKVALYSVPVAKYGIVTGQSMDGLTDEIVWRVQSPQPHPRVIHLSAAYILKHRIVAAKEAA